LRKIERQLKETKKDNWKIFPIVCFAFREKWSIKDEGDRWGSTMVIIKMPLSTEMAKFLNLLQFDRKITMRLRNIKTVLKTQNKKDWKYTILIEDGVI
jgi:hypothetical protein